MTAPLVDSPDRPFPCLVGEELAEDTSAAALRVTLRRTRPLATLHHWLIALLADPVAMAVIISESYWHPNGFAKLVLHREPEFRIRLHVWPSGPNRLGESEPHGHRWNFASTVLLGPGLSITEYVEDEIAEPNAIRFTYDGRRVKPDVMLHLRAKPPKEIAAGDYYDTDSETIHSVEPRGEDLVATLVLQGPRVAETTHVYAPSLATPMDRPGTPMTEADVRSLLEAVLAALGAGGELSHDHSVRDATAAR